MEEWVSLRSFAHLAISLFPAMPRTDYSPMFCAFTASLPDEGQEFIGTYKSQLVIGRSECQGQSCPRQKNSNNGPHHLNSLRHTTCGEPSDEALYKKVSVRLL